MAEYFAIDHRTSAKFPQLLTVETITEYGMHGGSLGGEYGKPLHKFLSTFEPGTSIEEMCMAMMLCYQRMWGLPPFQKHNFRARVDYENGHLNVSVPGNACGLNPSHGVLYDKKKTEGYKFSCHNTDDPVQQISLIAGLAALCDKARREIK